MPRVVPLRHWGQWIGAIITLGLLGLAGYVVANGKTLQFHLVLEYFPASVILAGVKVTLELTVLAMIIGIVLGATLAVMRLSPNIVMREFAILYAWFFRGTPLLVQLIFWFNIALFVPQIHFGPIQYSTNTLVTPFMACVLGLSLNEAAYMAEIVRAGIISIDRAQTDAAYALGYTRGLTTRTVVLPQAMRVIIPPTGNEAIGMLKGTSLVSVVGGNDLLTQAENIASGNFHIIELLMVASLWYLILTTVASVGQHFLEVHYAQGTGTTPVEGLFSGILRNIRTVSHSVVGDRK